MIDGLVRPWTAFARPFARMARADGKGRQIVLHARVDPSIPSRDISELCEYPLPWLCGFALMGLQSPPPYLGMAITRVQILVDPVEAAKRVADRFVS